MSTTVWKCISIFILLVLITLLLPVISCGSQKHIETKVKPFEAQTLKHGSGATIEVPAGAILEETTVSITQVESSDKSKSIYRQSFDFSFGDVELNVPVKIKIPYDTSNDVDPAELTAIHWSEDLNSWEVLGGVVDTKSKTVDIETTDFSIFST